MHCAWFTTLGAGLIHHEKNKRYTSSKNNDDQAMSSVSLHISTVCENWETIPIAAPDPAGCRALRQEPDEKNRIHS